MSQFFWDYDNAIYLLGSFEYCVPKNVSVGYREELFGDVIESDNSVHHETYERDCDTNTEDGKYWEVFKELVIVALSEKYCEVDVSIDEGNIYLIN